MRIGVLQTGSVPEEMVDRHGPYVAMFERLLQCADPSFTAQLWDVNVNGEIPNSPLDAAGWIITGSRHGVYEDHPWIEPLKTFLREAHAARVPLVGVCFGHQLMAEALGGKVVKSNRGWGAGIHEYTVRGRPEWMDPPMDTFRIQALHQDQVVEVPSGTTVLADSPFCPYAVLGYGDTAMSVQPHPEFSADFEREIISIRRGAVIPEGIVDDALAGVDGPTDSEMFGLWMTNFFRHAASKRQVA